LTKGPDAFRTISEASDELGVPQHVLRFWETRFSFIRPMKRAGGRRFYRPHDIAILRGVRRLLHDDGMSIKGVQQLHREAGVRRLLAAGEGVIAARRPPEDGPAETAMPEVAPVAPAATASLHMPQPAPAEPVASAPPPAGSLAIETPQGQPRRTPADLSDLERRRLRAALEDLTAIKAEIDELLARSS
jgi:DNA-binding transcriptional MerR regulator